MSVLLSPFRRSTAVPLLSSSTILTRTFSTSRPSQLARMTIVGRLGSDPEAITTNSGTEIIKYVVATSSGPKTDTHTSWFRVSSFPGKDAFIRERVMGLSKGTLVYLEGDATMRSFEDSEGKKQTQLSLVQTKLSVLKRPRPVEDGSAPSSDE